MKAVEQVGLAGLEAGDSDWSTRFFVLVDGQHKSAGSSIPKLSPCWTTTRPGVSRLPHADMAPVAMYADRDLYGSGQVEPRPT